jgi:hypothetical protein
MAFMIYGASTQDITHSFVDLLKVFYGHLIGIIHGDLGWATHIGAGTIITGTLGGITHIGQVINPVGELTLDLESI